MQGLRELERGFEGIGSLKLGSLCLSGPDLGFRLGCRV